MHGELLGVATGLIDDGPQPDDAVRLRRATSTAYYALFHALCAASADLLAGPGGPDWARVYRSLDHGASKSACERLQNELRFPPGLQRCAAAFIALQRDRHSADYDPGWTVTKAQAIAHVVQAREGIKALSASAEPDRRSFVLHLLFRERR